jgi:hypothetical protein
VNTATKVTFNESITCITVTNNASRLYVEHASRVEEGLRVESCVVASVVRTRELLSSLNLPERLQPASSYATVGCHPTRVLIRMVARTHTVLEMFSFKKELI